MAREPDYRFDDALSWGFALLFRGFAVSVVAALLLLVARFGYGIYAETQRTPEERRAEQQAADERDAEVRRLRIEADQRTACRTSQPYDCERLLSPPAEETKP